MTDAGTVTLDTTQIANAATIAAVGIRRAMPDQAIVIALATAMQESKLENLDGGDRDSIGLFQQRPSQGWGTPDNIADPRYSAGMFYQALNRVKGWQTMRVTEAAQRVQTQRLSGGVPAVGHVGHGARAGVGRQGARLARLRPAGRADDPGIGRGGLARRRAAGRLGRPAGGHLGRRR